MVKNNNFYGALARGLWGFSLANS